MQGAAAARYAVLLLAGASLAACATPRPEYAVSQPTKRPKAAPGYKIGAPYQVGGIWYVPKEDPNYDQKGVASWYGDAFNMKPTANGEIFDKDLPSAAHTTLPLPSLVEVTNLDNGKKLVVRVNDRGPFVDNRIIDLSHEAARQLGYDRAGLAHVRVRYIGPAPLMAGEETRRYAELALPKTSTRAAAAPPPPPKTSQDVRALTSAPLASVPLTIAPPVKVAQAALAPLPKAAAPALAPTATERAPLIGQDLPDLKGAEPAKPAGPRVEIARAATRPPLSGFRVQAGAFSTSENAEKAAARLADAGQARVEPLTRGGVTYYRVYVDGAADQDAAEALREKVADAGFPDARVLRPSL